MWVSFSYNLSLRDHIVFEGLEDIVEADVLARHEVSPSSKKEAEFLRLDPGGMIWLKNEPITSNFETGNVWIKPEHILIMIIEWKRQRVLSETTSSGEKIIKVYFGDRSTAIMPESIYNQIGSWLAFQKTNGYIARAEMSEILNESSNIVSIMPPAEGEA